MISQPALTRQIRQFEPEIGKPLFERIPTGVTPAPAGVALYRHAGILGQSAVLGGGLEWCDPVDGAGVQDPVTELSGA